MRGFCSKMERLLRDNALAHVCIFVRKSLKHMSGFRIWSLHQGFLPKRRLRWIELRDAQRFQYRGGLLAASGHAQLAACIQLQFHPRAPFPGLAKPKAKKEGSAPGAVFSRARSSKKASAAETLYPMVQDSIRDGVYPPHRGSPLCSRRHCGYWRECEREFGGRVPE